MATLVASALAASIDLPRGTLWLVVRGCAFAQRHADGPFPCRVVADGPEGYAILRVPGSRTHFLVAPTRPVPGLEAPAARGRTASGAWRAALAQRRLALPAAGADRTNVVFAAFGLSPEGRDLIEIATQTAGTSAEDALDDRCDDRRWPPDG